MLSAGHDRGEHAAVERSCHCSPCHAALRRSHESSDAALERMAGVSAAAGAGFTCRHVFPFAMQSMAACVMPNARATSLTRMCPCASITLILLTCLAVSFDRLCCSPCGLLPFSFMSRMLSAIVPRIDVQDSRRSARRTCGRQPARAQSRHERASKPDDALDTSFAQNAPFRNRWQPPSRATASNRCPAPDRPSPKIFLVE